MDIDKESRDFEAWAKSEGLIQESHGLRSVNSMCDMALKAWRAGRAALASQGEPVAWFDTKAWGNIRWKNTATRDATKDGTPFYTAPPAAVPALVDGGPKEPENIEVTPVVEGGKGGPITWDSVPQGWNDLYVAVAHLMAHIGAHGEVDTRHEQVGAVMNALHALDGGVVCKRALELHDKLHMPIYQAAELALREHGSLSAQQAAAPAQAVDALSAPKSVMIIKLNGEATLQRVGPLSLWALYNPEYVRMLNRFEIEFVDAALAAKTNGGAA